MPKINGVEDPDKHIRIKHRPRARRECRFAATCEHVYGAFLHLVLSKGVRLEKKRQTREVDYG
jgi:hypothetical protein